MIHRLSTKLLSPNSPLIFEKINKEVALPAASFCLQATKFIMLLSLFKQFQGVYRLITLSLPKIA